MDIPTLPVENVTLVTAFGKRSNRVRKQVMVTFIVRTEEFEANFFISPQLVNEAILGCQFIKNYGINLNFERGSFSYFRDNVEKEHLFYQTPETVRSGHSEQCCEKIPVPSTAYAGLPHLSAPV
jgi:hypothetical protein